MTCHDWLRRLATGPVPEAFGGGFLHQNPVDRGLLALVQRQAAS